MTTARQFSESEGQFNKWKPSDAICPKCRKTRGEVAIWESSDGAYEDYKHRCLECGHVWWIDGIDS